MGFGAEAWRARGSGEVGTEQEFWGVAWAADVLCLMDALGLPAPVLGGHSMGGMTAAVVAHTHPRPLRGLVLADPTFLTPQRLIQALDVPGLLIIGDVGSVVPREMGTELAGLNPRLRVEQITEAGHGLPYDQPERFSAVIQAFLRSVTSG